MKLEKCKCCGDDPTYGEKCGGFWYCDNPTCNTAGPNGDPTGEKWNALMAPTPTATLEVRDDSDLRERAAIAALEGLLVSVSFDEHGEHVLARVAVACADALVAALKGGAA